MVYSSPPDTTPPQTFRPQHRRTRSSTASFSTERGDGAFVSLGVLPRRKAAPKKFHFRTDDDEDDEDPPPIESITKRPPSNSLGLSVDTENLSPRRIPPHNGNADSDHLRAQSVPFPRSSPQSPQPFSPSPMRFSSRPSLIQRTPSSPVVLANGKPLKSSLKSSQSSPNLPPMHIRAQSAPSTPSLNKSVHFAGDDEDREIELEQVRVFRSSGKPANLLTFKPGEDTETETEVESSSYPFPRMSSYPSSSLSPSTWEIDPSPALTSPIPRPTPSQYANIHLESITLPKTRPPTLRGTVLVRNVSFEKIVAVRFTLDGWQTTSEVVCKHVVSLVTLPPPFPHALTVGDAVGVIAHANNSGALAASEQGSQKPMWDRFSFVIRLEDYEHRLNDRTLYIVGRYTAPGVGEWWDNNDGHNYRVGFRKFVDKPAENGGSSPVTSSHQQKSFNAPCTLKITPVTGGDLPTPPLSSSSVIAPQWTSSVPFPSYGGSGSVTRTVSGPPSTGPGMLPYSAPRQSGGSVKLRLANYAAPTAKTTVSAGEGALSPLGGVSPTFGFSALPGMGVGEEEARIEDVLFGSEGYYDGAVPKVRMPGEIVGGQPASSLGDMLSVLRVGESLDDGEAATPSMSSAESSPPVSGVVTPVNGAGPGATTTSSSSSTPTLPPMSNAGSTPNIKSTNDSTYAAFVRQWCFAQSPMGGSGSTPSSRVSTPIAAGGNGNSGGGGVNAHGWLGLEGYGFGGVGRRLGNGRSEVA